ncbi:MAG TPA: acyl-CoA thioesterase, partial [Novosphingobium sp.]
MTFISKQAVRFAHVDAAGIVFYPRYFEMLNAAVEDFFAREVGVDFAEMHLVRKLGVPTVSLNTTFVAPSRLGEMLEFRLTVKKVGRSSMDLAALIDCDGTRRFEVAATLVCMDLVRGRA